MTASGSRIAPTTCPVCGHAVTVVGDPTEGTMHYEPVEAEAAQADRERVRAAILEMRAFEHDGDFVRPSRDSQPDLQYVNRNGVLAILDAADPEPLAGEPCDPPTTHRYRVDPVDPDRVRCYRCGFGRPA